MNTAQGFVDLVLSTMASEHGCSAEEFRQFERHIVEAFATEGHITDEELFTLCCGEEEEMRPLEPKYPKLTKIFEAVFTGEDPITGEEMPEYRGES